MSKPEPQNPYESPRYEPVSNKPFELGEEPPFQGNWRMDYFGGFSMIHANPNWLMNCFLAGLCFLIPIAGFMVVLGYAFETAEMLHRTNGKRYLDFNFNRFGDYLSRGVGPFLIWLIFYFISMAFSMVIALSGVLAEFQARNPGNANNILFATSIGGNIMNMILGFTAPLIYYPLQIRSGLSREVGEAFNVGKAFEFFGKMWLEMILVNIVYFFCSILLGLIGILTCCIGLIPVAAYLNAFLNGWFAFQLYRVYLSKGGEPIPFKPLPVNL